MHLCFRCSHGLCGLAWVGLAWPLMWSHRRRFCFAFGFRSRFHVLYAWLCVLCSKYMWCVLYLVSPASVFGLVVARAAFVLVRSTRQAPRTPQRPQRRQPFWRFLWSVSVRCVSQTVCVSSLLVRAVNSQIVVINNCVARATPAPYATPLKVHTCTYFVIVTSIGMIHTHDGGGGVGELCLLCSYVRLDAKID